MATAAILFLLAILPWGAVSSCIQEYGSVDELHVRVTRTFAKAAATFPAPLVTAADTDTLLLHV
jgi:hypothetical protein